jgi:hypothetical protein
MKQNGGQLTIFSDLIRQICETKPFKAA